MLHEAWGLNDDIRAITDRLGGMGYVALAPDLLDGGRLTCMARAMVDMQRGSGRTPRLVEEVADWLASRDDVDGERVGAIGFCMGGGFAFMLGLSGKAAAVAPNYGKPPSDLDELERSCPVVASYGGRDLAFGRYGPKVQAALEAGGVGNDVVTYPGSGHSFMNRAHGHRISKAINRPILRTGYNAADAEDAWIRIERFFAEHLAQV